MSKHSASVLRCITEEIVVYLIADAPIGLVSQPRWITVKQCAGGESRNVSLSVAKHCGRQQERNHLSSGKRRMRCKTHNLAIHVKVTRSEWVHRRTFITLFYGKRIDCQRVRIRISETHAYLCAICYKLISCGFPKQGLDEQS